MLTSFSGIDRLFRGSLRADTRSMSTRTSGTDTTVLVVDDALPTRERLCRLVADISGVKASGCGATMSEVLPRLVDLRPRCVVIDVPVHDSAGFELLEQVRQNSAECAVVVLTNHMSEEFRCRGRAAGVELFLDKSTEFEHVLELVKHIGREP